MKATAKIADLKSIESQNTIIRNLSRILDIRIVDIDIIRGMVSFLYDSPGCFEKVKQELRRIGHPITDYSCTAPNSKKWVHGDFISDIAI
jgi:hypothetical protein